MRGPWKARRQRRPYNVTVDKNSDWKITDVGGVDGALPMK